MDWWKALRCDQQSHSHSLDWIQDGNDVVNMKHEERLNQSPWIKGMDCRHDHAHKNVEDGAHVRMDGYQRRGCDEDRDGRAFEFH